MQTGNTRMHFLALKNAAPTLGSQTIRSELAICSFTPAVENSCIFKSEDPRGRLLPHLCGKASSRSPQKQPMSLEYLEISKEQVTCCGLVVNFFKDKNIKTKQKNVWVYPGLNCLGILTRIINMCRESRALTPTNQT